MPLVSHNLFKPFKLGNLELQHRVVLAPATRFRTTSLGPSAAPLPQLVKTYYQQRSSIPGTFLIAEGTNTAERASGYPGVGGIFTKEQIAAWKDIVDGVHTNGSFIFLQIASMGRTASPDFLKSIDPSYDVIAPSPIPISLGGAIPRELTVDEIKENIEMFTTASCSAVGAGFDGVEIHGTNGFLLDQFIQEVSNQRTDSYGGSIENRSRFVLEVVDAVANTIGPEKTGLRLSPFSTNLGMGMKDPYPQFTYLVNALKRHQPHLAYLHVLEPGIDPSNPQTASQSNDFIRDIWYPRPLISCGGYTRDSGIEVADQHENELVAYARHFIANPDLPRRLKENLPLNKFDRTTFYTHEEAGYTDYPFAA